MSKARPGDRSDDHFETRVTGRRYLTRDTFLLDIARPPEYQFLPGQRAQITLDGISRDYSLIPRTGGDTLTLLIRRIPGGALTTLLGDCAMGTDIGLSVPGGHFVYRHGTRSAVFVATGTGVAPFIAMCREGTTGMIFLQGARRRDELYFRDTFEAAASLYIACISAGVAERVSGADSPGRVTGYLEEQLPSGDYDFYLAGSGAMIADAVEIIDNRFPSSRIYSEIFF